MKKAQDIANFFLRLSDPDTGDILSNLKLQKLAYYAQGFHLAMYDERIFQEPILAWAHGPVVRDLYYEYRKYGNNAIPQPEDFDVSIFNKNQIELLKEIHHVYGQFSAWKLRNMTHSEAPYLQTRRNQVIDVDLMKEFFKTQLVSDEEHETAQA